MSTALSVSVAHSEGEGKHAWVEIKIGDRAFWFQRESASASDRHAVVEFLRKALADQIEAVRLVEYERGYKHGRRKQAKEHTGSSTLYIADWMKP